MKTPNRPSLRPAALATATLALAATSAFAQTTLLTDCFDTVGIGNNVSPFLPFNESASLAADQTGTLATKDYTLSSTGWDGYFQRGAGGQMLLAGYDFPEGGGEFSGQVFASVNYNFASDANTLNAPLEIKFNLDVTDTVDSTNWGTIAVGSSQNAFVNDPANKFSSLFRDNGGTEQFASAVTVGPGVFTFTDGDLITLLLSDTAGTGSAFNGNGSVAKLYVNGVLKATFTGLGLGASDGYISFQANGAKALYDNLVITAVSAADPYLAWINATWPALSDKTPTGDPDNDGIANIVEYVLQGGDPSVSTTGILPTLNASGTDFVFTFSRRTAATGTVQTFESSTNLSDWTTRPPLAIPAAAGTYGEVVVGPATGTPPNEVQAITITIPKGAETKLFGRLQVVK